MEKYHNNLHSENDDDLDIKELAYSYLKYWKLILLSMLLSMGLGYLYLKFTPKKYLSESKILINSGNNDNLIFSGLTEISDLSDFSRSKLDDWIEMLKSRRLVSKVIEKLNLNIQYTKKNRFVSKQVYEKDASVYVRFINEKSKYLIDNSKHLEVVIYNNDKFICKSVDTNNEFYGEFGKPVKFPFGDIIFFRNPISKPGERIFITIKPIIDVTLEYISALNIENVNKNGNILSLGMQTILPDNANKMLDLLVLQLQEDILDDRNKIGQNTISFINERLSLISKDLTITDNDMEKYKSGKRIVSVETEERKEVQESSRIEEQLKQFSIQLSLIDYMEKFITSNNNSLLPSNIGLTDASLISTTQEFNKLVLERDKLLESSTKENPMVKNLDIQIRDYNNNLRKSLRNYKNSTSIAIENLQKQMGQISSKISELPAKERGFKDIFRKQQTVEALYLLLLQKREEIEITAASTPSVVKVVDKAFYSSNPVYPKSNIILFISSIIGFIIPVGALHVRFFFDNKVKTKKEIEKVVANIPFVGYIPKAETNIVDIQSANSSSAEAFRILRTNVNFLLPEFEYPTRCIYVTSTISGEGKTYSSVNLAFTLALANKKVLLIEGDIRKPKVRENLGITDKLEGITEYLSGNITDLSGTIKSIYYSYNKQFISSLKIDVLTSGRIPPNPSELLMNGKFADIIEFGRNNYDYVIVDTAPVGVVTDTLLINNYADIVLYLIRVNYLQRNMLDVLVQLQREGKLNLHKTAILINNVDSKGGYGYGGAYTYGYGESKQSWFKKIIKNYILKT
jgi:tyrosine-protein kinase Etk/Wzc